MILLEQMPFINAHLIEFLIRLSLNTIVTLIVVRYIYFPVTRRKDYLFTLVLMNIVVFFLVYLLADAQIEMGFAFGMFAIFGIIRYRTNPIHTKEMTYLFVVIGISVVNAITNDKISILKVILANLVLVFVTYILEKVWLTKQDLSKTITYERIELIRPERSEELLSDLRERTGLDIHRVEIGSIDFLRDVVKIRIFFFAPTQGGHIADEGSI
ncbi:MAG: DUF4956 domain-containing protein [Bacteroidales bacterium]|nr:DUF4956 domain-containing protein [Bacteroidales bacterium]